MPSPDQSLRERFQELNEATSRRAAQLATEGKKARLWTIMYRPGLVFMRVYIWQGGWRLGMIGFSEAIFAAYEVFVSWLKLWEFNQGRKSS